MTNKRKMDKLDFIKMKNTGASKGIIKNVKGQHTEWEKVFANHISDRGSMSRIDKELLQLNRKTTIQFLKWAKNTNRHFSKEGIQMANKPINRH